MTVLIALLLGLVQGITEFLPVSSSGHLAVLQNFMNVQEPDLIFEVLVHMGTLVSIFVVYRIEVRDMIRDGLEYIRFKSDSNADEPVSLKPPGRALLFVFIGTLPMFVAVFFVSSIERLFFNTFFIGFAFLITGGLLYVSSRFIKQGNKTDKTMTIADALIIGLAQAVALLPGLSRSGTTISVGLARGLNGAFAVRFSLLLSIPAVLGATIVTFYRAIIEGADFSMMHAYIAGFVVAAGVGYFAIQFIRRIIGKRSFGNIAYYCWGIGIVTIIWSLIRL
ncbi:MAG: undecaprenyl-diphosphate phosphatase [Oscillospiraceae bacterium]|nr:undecaprenyl-diphosphate phosphatase [Oscillospiraceae bacterium]MCL2278421.1 undecaprenyl-diphosphate phosphatase [Oscillospiraceae bacterium]